MAAASNNEVIRDKSNDELLERLHTQLHREDNRQLPIINQCINTNAELVNRCYRHSSRTMTGLALIAPLPGVCQLRLFLLR